MAVNLTLATSSIFINSLYLDTPLVFRKILFGFTIKVGMSVPLSGPLAEYGAAIKNGVELANVDFNLGTTEFIWDDNKYDAKTAVSSLNDLVDHKKADLLYSWGEVSLHAQAEIAERRKIPLVSMSYFAAPAVGKNFIVRSINPTDDFVALILQDMRKMGHRKIAVVMAEDPFFESFYNSFQKLKNQGEELVLVHKTSAEDSDFRTPILKLRKGNFDAVVVLLFSGQVSTFYRQLKSGEVHLASYGTDIFHSKQEKSNAQGAMLGARYPIPEVPLEFERKYLAKYQNETHLSFAYNAYIFAAIVAKMTATVDSSPEEVINNFCITASQESSLKYLKTPENGSFLSFNISMETA